MKRIGILGSTGSVGQQTLEVCSWFPDRFKVEVLTANSNVELLASQAKRFLPRVIAIADSSCYQEAKRLTASLKCEVLTGVEGICAAAETQDIDVIVAAVSGIAGLLPVMAAIKAGRDIAIANKEVLVAAGRLVIRESAFNGIKLLPIDSEHSAIFQCLEDNKNSVDSLILTASGGPFANFSFNQLRSVTPDMALKHPIWKMGKKISIDSATMMNKGLEVIEARWLFDIPVNRIRVVIHPQGILHSMVQYSDSAIIAQLGPRDMRIPIQYALSYPERILNEVKKIDLTDIGALDFSKPDMERFRCLSLAYQAAAGEDSAPIVLNAANEVMVLKFLRGEVKFTQIAEMVEKCLEAFPHIGVNSLEEVFCVDKETRLLVDRLLS